MGVKICWWAAKSRREKGGLKKRKRDIPPRRLLSIGYCWFIFSALFNSERKQDKEGTKRLTHLWGNRLIQISWNSRDGMEDKLKHTMWKWKKREKLEAIMRGAVRLAGGKEKGTDEVRETEDGEVISRFSLAWYSVVLCDVHWRWLYITVFVKALLTSLFSFIISSCLSVLLSLFSFFCKQKLDGNREAGQLVAILSGHHLDIRGIKTHCSGMESEQMTL